MCDTSTSQFNEVLIPANLCSAVRRSRPSARHRDRTLQRRNECDTGSCNWQEPRYRNLLPEYTLRSNQPQREREWADKDGRVSHFQSRGAQFDIGQHSEEALTGDSERSNPKRMYSRAYKGKHGVAGRKQGACSVQKKRAHPPGVHILGGL